jgi:acyl-coenzyme A synthetase/AMP-(fatty) acid ligase/acyl carrier protein
VLYTSGSTGNPKGVCVEHAQVVNFLTHFQREGLVRPGDRLLAVTTLSFDIAVLELLLPLTVGATVLLASREEARDPHALATLLDSATVMQATPATWRALVESGWRGRADLRLLSGGEALPRDLADVLLPRGAELWNLYGPTETTIWSTATPVAAEGPIHVGRPIANTRLRIVDPAGRAVPIGAPGELLIGGAGVARGYWQRPDLTAERFLDRPDGRWYRTGDRARRRPDGTLEVIGRLDDQVKLQGHRLELGEVEAALRAHSAVADAAAAVREDRPGDRRLVAYVVPRGSAPEPLELRRFLEGRLPTAVVPSRVVVLDALPRTPNGKLDRKALPAPPEARPATMAPFEPPAGELEGAIAEVLQEVLGLDRVGALDNFFDLGGSSLLAMQALGRLRARLGQEIPLVAIFQHPNARTLAAHLEGATAAASAAGIERGEVRQAAADARARRMAARRAHREGET